MGSIDSPQQKSTLEKKNVQYQVTHSEESKKTANTKRRATQVGGHYNAQKRKSVFLQKHYQPTTKREYIGNNLYLPIRKEEQTEKTLHL